MKLKDDSGKIVPMLLLNFQVPGKQNLWVTSEVHLKQNIFSSLLSISQKQNAVQPCPLREEKKKKRPKKLPKKQSRRFWAPRGHLTTGLLSLDFFFTVLFLFQATIFGFAPAVSNYRKPSLAKNVSRAADVSVIT